MDIINQFIKDSMEGEPTEHYLDEVNAATRQELSEFADKHEQVWLGKINLYDGDNGDLWPYVSPDDPNWEREKHFVFNFGAAFAVPQNNAELVQMIKDRKNRVYTGTADDFPLVTAIIDKVHELKGILLIWA